MLIRSRAVLAAVLVLSATGCPKKTGDQSDAASEASAPVAETDAAPPPPAVTAANAGQVAHFPNETPLANVAADIVRQANVRDAPPNGSVIATLPAGSKCEQVAQRERYFLILFDDPKDKSRKLMGWVVDDVFKAVATPKKIVCTAPEVLLVADAPFCGRVCKADGDCKPGETCTGKAKQGLPDGGAGADVQSCVAPKVVDAGAPVVADAAAPPATQDAGTTPPAAQDAGAAKPDAAAPAQTGPVIDAQGGKCPDKYRLVTQTGKCHMLCAGTPAVCGKLPCSKQTYGEPAVCVPK